MSVQLSSHIVAGQRTDMDTFERTKNHPSYTKAHEGEHLVGDRCIGRNPKFSQKREVNGKVIYNFCEGHCICVNVFYLTWHKHVTEAPGCVVDVSTMT